MATHPPALDQQPAKAPAKRVIEHLFWVEDLESGCTTGMPVRSLCGGKRKKAYMPVEQQVVQVVGSLVPIFITTDCRNCARVLAAKTRRDWERANR